MASQPIDADVMNRLADPDGEGFFAKGDVVIRLWTNIENTRETSVSWGHSIALNRYELIGLLKYTLTRLLDVNDDGEEEE